MEITVMTGLLAERDMDINSGQWLNFEGKGTSD